MREFRPPASRGPRKGTETIGVAKVAEGEQKT